MREQIQGKGTFRGRSHRPTANESRYRARECSGGGVIDLQPMREQMQGMEEFRGRSHIRPTVNERADKGHGKVQGEES